MTQTPGMIETTVVTENQAYVVMLPLTYEQNMAASKAMFTENSLCRAIESSILTIGTPVDSSVPVAGYGCPRDFEAIPKRSGYYISGKPFADWFPLVRQSDHLAALAEKQAEVDKLAELLDKTTAKSFLEYSLMKRRLGAAS
ncbi:hypothetical protein A0U92_03445 [Acetobacter aceti]|uniref:Uncharacterized protein n=1 Tax=Acetobacter aceti TaxID=435 RepID=A0A1U9KDU2_ACEAC|nr:hypothetical protein [Acetobacter aceti]AQS83975.1 hypothetical protein A0U92_03445 [Acetobacter aceti]